MHPGEPGAELSDIAARVATCQLCRLCHDRRNGVPGCGNPGADVMFVAEAPGYHEDRSGQAFTGDGGVLLDSMLEGIGLQRSDVWLTTVLKCRTPRSRSPFPDEIEQCEGYLFREIALVQPLVICALGNTAARVLTGRPMNVGESHGTPMQLTLGGRQVIVLPLYHPSAVVQVQPLVPVLRSDMSQLPRLIRDGMSVTPSRVADVVIHPQAESDDDADPQLSLTIG